MPAHFSRPKRSKMSLLAQVNKPKEWQRKFKESFSTGSENLQAVNPTNLPIQPIEQQQNDQAGEAIGETVAFHSGAVLNDPRNLARFISNFDPQQPNSRASINLDAMIRENGSSDLPSNPPIGSIDDDSSGNYRMGVSDGNDGNVVVNVQNPREVRQDNVQEDSMNNPQEDPMQNATENRVQHFGQNLENQQQQEPSSVVTDSSVRSQNCIRKRPNRRSQTLKLKKRLTKKRRSRKRSRKVIAKRYPCKRGTRHGVHEIVYQYEHIDGDDRFLMDWSALNWKLGPTFVEFEDVDKYAPYYHKHYLNMAMYDKWVENVGSIEQFAMQIETFWSAAQEIANPTADELKVIGLFERRFRSVNYDLGNKSAKRQLWHKWNIYCFGRFVFTRITMPNKPHGDSWSYGHFEYQRICRYVGEKKRIEHFAVHVPETSE